MYIFFIGLKFVTAIFFVLKCLLIPALSLLLWYMVYMLWLKLSKRNQPYPVHVKIINAKSAIFAIGLLSIYFSVLIYFNGIDLFTWGQFPVNIGNIYFLLLPLIISYIALIVIYFNAKNSIHKLLK